MLRIPGLATLTSVVRSGLLQRCSDSRLNSSKAAIHDLRLSFANPSSPFYIAPGTQGPASPDAPVDHLAIPEELSTSLSNNDKKLKIARENLASAGFEPTLYWSQQISWGDHDAFQHVNNVRYVRFFESGRILWMTALGNRIGGPKKAEEMLRGQGISLILKSIKVDFRRPVTYPDTLLVAYRPIPPPPSSKIDPALFHMTASAYSLNQGKFVAHSNEELVWYDYTKLRKCDPGEAIRSLL